MFQSSTRGEDPQSVWFDISVSTGKAMPLLRKYSHLWNCGILPWASCGKFELFNGEEKEQTIQFQDRKRIVSEESGNKKEWMAFLTMSCSIPYTKKNVGWFEKKLYSLKEKEQASLLSNHQNLKLIDNEEIQFHRKHRRRSIVMSLCLFQKKKIGRMNKSPTITFWKLIS